MENKIHTKMIKISYTLDDELIGLFDGYGLKTLVEDVSDDGDGELRFTEEGEKFVEDLFELLLKDDENI